MTENNRTPEPTKRQKSDRLLQEGRERFLNGMERQLQQMEELFDQLGIVPSWQGAEQWYRIVHTIKGSAPIFGLSSIGQMAEELLKEWEWTQSEKLAEQNEAWWVEQAAASLQNSGGVLLQLKLERDFLLRELQLAVQKEFGVKNGNPLENSRVLVIDDDPVLRSYLVKRLELDSYIAEDASDVDTAKRMLHEHHYDLVLLDLMMYPKSGYELFEFLQEDPTLKWLPLIVLSAREDLNDKVNCLMLGACDYLTKPFRYEELAARIYTLLNRTKNFEQMAFRDPLTGVYNRRYFDHHVELELQRISRYPAPISIAFIDIDRFKSVNDTHGHAIGDLVLQGLAHMVQKRLRNTDVLARYGGEEFVVLFPNTTAPQAQKLLNDVLQYANSHPVAQHEGTDYSITFSAGVAEWVPGQKLQQWVRLADEAMYAAKQQGRNRVLTAGADSMVADEAAQQPVPARKRVLVADDDEILRSIVVARLALLPVDVIEACDGDEAFRLLQGEAVDLCILDGIMPGMDGLEVLQRMQAEPELRARETRVMMLSGRRRDDDIARGLESGADDYMSKPFSLIELDRRVKRLLGLE
ncbi:diguanylate cyclase [Paenibacillus koleovorans]|uniref:diguanylate cyclase n=1 Tax=Paenibacillus koleovorans TaxID=121608 RepID=UPI000FD7F49C|nr:diguanylate cyclase [Paenibacillus koleovorans]